MEVLSPTDSMTVGEENEEIVETETVLLRRIQSTTLAFGAAGMGGAMKGVINDPFSGSKRMSAQVPQDA